MVLLSGSRQLDLSVLWVRVLVFGSMQLFRSRARWLRIQSRAGI